MTDLEKAYSQLVALRTSTVEAIAMMELESPNASVSFSKGMATAYAISMMIIGNYIQESEQVVFDEVQRLFP